MTRRKKTRKTGPLAPSKTTKPAWEKPKPDQTRAYAGKGNKPGSRFNVKTNDGSKANNQHKSSNDPRHGSKKPIELVSPAPQSTENDAAAAELHALENDPRLQSLLTMVEEGTELNDADILFLDKCTERFAELAAQLGIELEDDDDEDSDD